MKQYWQRLALKIDALSLRERVIIFAMASLILIMLVNTALLDPLYAKQKQLSQRVKQEQSQIAAMQAEIQQKAASQAVDPDSANKARQQQLQQQSMQLQATLRDMQKGLVSSDKMSELLEDILKQNGKLRLVSLKTLATSGLSESVLGEKRNTEQDLMERAFAPIKDKKETVESKPAGESTDKRVAESIYRHGVEIVVQGGYLDILDYLAQLEAMPWQLFWGKAKLDSNEYPKTTLRLTLYTLSLDKKWLNI